VNQSRYTPEQRAALIALGEMDEQGPSTFTESQLADRFRTRGFDPSRLGRALNDLVNLRLAEQPINWNATVKDYMMTEKGRDEYNAEK
jgi:hypothetical protein